jgi:hypothetical protein
VISVKRLSAAIVASLALAACATDSVAEPEPAFDMLGAFVAVDDGKGPLTLIRTLDTLETEVGKYLFVTIYDAEPVSWSEAEELSRDPDLPISRLVDVIPYELVTDNEYRVVWFRTLTDEEKERS